MVVRFLDKHFSLFIIYALVWCVLSCRHSMEARRWPENPEESDEEPELEEESKTNSGRDQLRT